MEKIAGDIVSALWILAPTIFILFFLAKTFFGKDD
jgi:hypothetical protein